MTIWPIWTNSQPKGNSGEDRIKDQLPKQEEDEEFVPFWEPLEDEDEEEMEEEVANKERKGGKKVKRNKKVNTKTPAHQIVYAIYYHDSLVHLYAGYRSIDPKNDNNNRIESYWTPWRRATAHVWAKHASKKMDIIERQKMEIKLTEVSSSVYNYVHSLPFILIFYFSTHFSVKICSIYY